MKVEKDDFISKLEEKLIEMAGGECTLGLSIKQYETKTNNPGGRYVIYSK